MGIKDEEKIEKSTDIRIMGRLLPYVNKEIIIFITSLLLIGIATAIDLTVPYLTKIAIDDGISANKDPIVLVDKGGVVIEGQKYKKIKATELGDISDVYYLKYSDGQNYLVSDNEILSITKDQYLRFREADKSLVFRITLILIGLLVVKFIFSFASVYMLSVASQNIIYSIRSDLYEHMLSLSLKFFDRNPIGRLVTRVTSDMDNISKLFTDVLITVLKDLFLIGGAVFVMLSLDYKLGLIAMATLPLVILISMIFRHFARSVQRDVKIKLAKINASLSESINGMNLIQIFNREKLSQEEFDIKNRDFLKTSLQETKLYALFRPGIHLMSGISLGLILLFGGFSSVSGVLEIGVLVAFFQYINHLFRPISDLAEKFNIFQSSMASSERVFMLLDTKEDVLNPVNSRKFDTLDGGIELKDVCFSYIPGDKVLKNINLEVKPGETVALVGATGSGKTTITSLISRLYDIDSGSITVDGVDIRDIDKDVLRKRIAVVLQDVFIFSGDVKGNINLNNNNISYDKVVESSKYVNAHRFISKLGKKYDHEVKERGESFSAGEKQLLSFARALAFNPDILILDEATSSIDTETEALIQDAIIKLIEGRTTIIVAHRLSTIKHADKIVVLHKGEIKEVGKHDELIAKGGMYYDLYKLQVEA